MNLIEAMRSEFGKSKKWYNRRLFINFMLLILSITVVSVSVGMFAMVVGISLLILPVLSFVFRELSAVHQGRAENIRRSLMLLDGLGHKPSDLELNQLEVDLGKIDTSEPPFVEPYYNSTLPKGANRLAEISAESVFFTKNLSKRSAMIFLLSASIGVAILIVALYVLIQADLSKTAGEIIAKCIASIMVFLISGDFAFLYRRYHCLDTACERILSKCDVLRKMNNASVEEVMKAVDDYNCAVIQAPPIPALVYKRMLSSLNKAWRDHKELER